MNDNSHKTSLQKSADMLAPFLLYYIVSRITQLCLLQLIAYVTGRVGEPARIFLSEHSAEVNLILMLLYMSAGLAVIGKTALKEIRLGEKRARIMHSHPIAGYLFLAGLAFTSAVGINICFSLIGFTQSSESYTRVAEQQMAVPLWMGLLMFGILTPLAEEVLFRGIIYNRMKKYFSVVLSMLLSSFLFGVYHGNIVQGVYGSLMGVLLVLVYDRYGTFAAPFLFHCIANISSLLITQDARVYAIISGPLVGIALVSAAGAGTVLLIKKKMKGSQP